MRAHRGVVVAGAPGDGARKLVLDEFRREGRELELTVNGHSEEILRRLQSLSPEELTTETLTLEEIFVAALK